MESRDLQYEVVKLRALVPQNYQKHLHRENKQYFKQLNAIEVRVQPTNNATNVQRYEFAIDDNLVEWQRYTLNANRSKEKADRLMKCMDIMKEQSLT